jgi:hypothetical protein
MTKFQRERSESSSRQREFSRRKTKWRITMTGLKTLVAAALISTISVTSALAQAAISEPAYAYDEDRLVLRDGLSTHKHVFKSELKSG